MKIKSFTLPMAVCVLLLLVSCGNEKKDTPIVGHWGVEQYVSCRTDSAGFDRWDTLNFEAGAGKGYEVFFYNNGKAKLLLNESAKSNKAITCKYDFNTEEQTLTIRGSSWMYALHGTQLPEENKVSINVDILNDTALSAWWTNNVSEAVPFYESFVLKAL